MQQPHPNRPGLIWTQPVWWVIAVSLAIIAINMTFRKDSLMPPALAQSVQSAGARGIFAFSGQLGPNSHGVFMVDVDSGTIWCYEFVTVGGIKKLELISGRSWIFDRYLEQYNIKDPTPVEVRNLVEQQRSSTAKQPSGTPPSSGGTP